MNSRLAQVSPRVAGAALYHGFRRRNSKMALDDSLMLNEDQLAAALEFLRDKLSPTDFEKIEQILTPADDFAEDGDRPPAYAALPGGGMQRAMAGDAARKLMAGDEDFLARFPNASRIRQL